MFKFRFLIVFITVITTGVSRSNNIIVENWHRADSILKVIKEPVFPDKVYNILDYGAKADSVTNNTKAIAEAIKVCNKNGGGQVLVPEGGFYTGPIHLLSNVNLHISENATLLFSVNPKDYLPIVLSRWEGVDCYNYSPLIYANGVENIAVTGKGRLDGQAANDNWWPWKGKTNYGYAEGMKSQLDKEGRPRLLQYNIDEVPVEDRKFGEGGYLRPPFIQFIYCKNILLEDFTINRSPFWIIHPLLSENITVRGLHINSHGPNTDGCDPEACKNILIEDCYFNTGDDCIALKSGRNEDGRNKGIPVENIIVRNCKMNDGHGGIVVGSEISGGCKNLFVENCQMNSPHLDRAVRIKTSAVRGGTIENIYIRNIEVGEVKHSVVKINCIYEAHREKNANFPPIIQNVYIDNITSNKSKYAFDFVGLKGHDCIKNIHISNSSFQGVHSNYKVKDAPMPVLKNVKVNGEKLN